jgi:hypothetical protein
MTRLDLNRWQPLTPDGRILWLKYWWGPGSANALAFARADGTWAIVSPPLNVPQPAYDHIQHRGRVAALIAPNAFHHLGQSEWRARCPDAVSYAPAGALERLARKSPNITYRSVEDSLDALAPASPLLLHGMKRPDLLLRIATPAGALWWVGDQFSNTSKHDLKFLLRIVSRLVAHGPGFGLNPKPELVFVSDRKAWLASLQTAVNADPPSILVCAHGDPVVADTAHRTAMAIDLVARMGAKKSAT